MEDFKMTELVKFTNEEFGEITTMEIDGEVWFLGKEIAEVLGYNTDKIKHEMLYDYLMDQK